MGENINLENTDLRDQFLFDMLGLSGFLCPDLKQMNDNKT